MALFGVRLLINIFDLCIYWRFLEVFLGKRKTSVETAIVFLAVCEIAGSAVNELGINWLNFIALAVILGIFICQYQGKISAKVIAVLLYMGLVVVAEPAGYVIYRLFEFEFIRDVDAAYYFMAFAVVLFRAVMVEIFCRIKTGKRLRVSAIPKEVAYMLIFIPSASLVCCFLVMEVAEELISVRTVILCICIIFAIVITNYVVFLMIEKYTDIEEKRYEEELVLSEVAYQNEYYEDMEKYQEQIQDIRHDMKNRLAALYDAAEEGNSSVMTAALKEMLEDISLTEDIIYSANPVLNSILKLKAAKAKESSIKTDIQVFIPKRLSIETGDMGVLYGNLLDNAIEACRQIRTEERHLAFETKYQEGNLFILVRNSKTGEENRRLATTKTDKRKHGRGIRAVRRVAEKYGGTLLLEDKGNIFEAKLLLTGVARLE